MFNEIVNENVQGIPAKIFIRDSEGTSNRTISPMHFHDEIELLFVISGAIRFTLNDETYDIRENMGMLINRRVPHMTQSIEDGTKTLLLQINIEKLMKREYSHINKYLSLIFSGDERDFYVFEKDAPEGVEVYSHMQKIESEYIGQKKGFNTYIKGELYHILACMYRYEILNDVGFKYDKDGMRKISDALLYVDKNFSKQITLEEISDVVNMNPSYFCRFFKKATGKTVMEYINFVRIWKAENLLSLTDESILEISMEVGFSSVSYFNRVFKKLKGASPMKYRKFKYMKN